MFDEALIELVKEKKVKYKFRAVAGRDFRNAVFNLFKCIWDKENKPDQWRL